MSHYSSLNEFYLFTSLFCFYSGQLSTYRELCSLATDLNQPDLIYKFMHLANHNAIWNSKKGAAFGFGSIAKKAGQQLAPYLPEIVPKLYRLNLISFLFKLHF